MDTGHKRYEIFLKVAETGNITHAAEILHYTQSGVSHAIAALEKETGFPVFRRSRHGVVLTPGGQRLVRPIRQLVNQKQDLAQVIADINHVVSGTLRIGTFTSVSVEWLPGLIQQFRQRYRNVDFELCAGDYDEIREGILDGRLDCGFLTEAVAGKMAYVPLYQDEMKVLMNPQHPLARQAAISLEDLLSEDFIVPLAGSDDDLWRAVRPYGNQIHVRYRLNDDFSVMALVAGGFGISLMPDLLLHHLNFDLVSRSLTPPVYRILGIASLSGRQPAPVTRTFLQTLPEMLARLPQNLLAVPSESPYTKKQR